MGSCAVLALILMSVIVTSPLRTARTDLSTLEQLSRDTRTAMEWTRTGTSPEARFLVLTSADSWWADRTAEWFPQLADRASLTTVQGLEWAGPGVFTRKQAEVARIKSMQRQSPEALAEAVATDICGADHVALFLPRRNPARRAFLKAAGLQLVFANADAAIFRKTLSPTGCRQ
jgi:hypothetical protein